MLTNLNICLEKGRKRDSCNLNWNLSSFNRAQFEDNSRHFEKNKRRISIIPSAEFADYEISELFFYRYVLVFMALIGFEVTSEPSLESFGINLACFHALLAD